ncbi:hypothetical protein LAV72_18695 [Lysinibacillus xylanilyticus]|uniref:hypothetical protein n=1 Tax=Lysinibacillus TaxID=400634 RepID=UPI002B25623D|nr:hypothetical protein [Lysinibacillus xylanilyticus]MEB2301636.1 hypothetical protein [Lysinibacillus xylanilyticus]
MKDTIVQIGLVVLGVLIVGTVVFGLFKGTTTDYATEGNNKVQGTQTIIKAAEIKYK